MRNTRQKGQIKQKTIPQIYIQLSCIRKDTKLKKIHNAENNTVLMRITSTENTEMGLI